MSDIEVGDRVIATIGNTGWRRRGVVTVTIDTKFQEPSPQFFVHFDGDYGHSGPCVAVGKEEK